VTLSGIEDELVERHRQRVGARGVSLEQELREVLTQAEGPIREELLAEMDRIRAMTPAPKPGQRWYSAEELVREARESR
jgi:plasmid stability protein